VRDWRAVLGGVLIATPGSQLRDSLDTNVQEFELLADETLGHTPAQLLNQEPHTAVLRSREGVENHTFLPIKRDDIVGVLIWERVWLENGLSQSEDKGRKAAGYE
jgi:hypothetical protein